MNKLRATLTSLLILGLLAFSACGGTNPVSSDVSLQPDKPEMLGVNTEGVIIDGVTFRLGQPRSVAPGSEHLVGLEPPPEYEAVPFTASCSGGSWVEDGKKVGYVVVTTDNSLIWIAPETPQQVQLLFVPADGTSGAVFGIVVSVTDDWHVNPIPNTPIVREAAFADPLSGDRIVAADGELLVKLAANVPLTELLNLRAAHDYQVLDRIDARDPVFRVRFDPEVDLIAAWTELSNDPRTEIVEPNYIAYPALVPDDPDYSKKHEFPKIDAEDAWDIATGSEDVLVAVIDTGADRDHPDLADNVVPGADFIVGGDGLGGETPGDGVDNNQDGIPDQNVGHGSHVAGIIAAQAFNGEGACGIAFNAKILPLRIFPTNGDTGATFSSIIEAINYAAEEEDVRVISMSIGTTYESPLLQAAINDAWDAGKVLVAAAANSNTSDRFYPAAHNHVVAVAALNKEGEKASFSNYGDWVDISAYGTGIYSTCFDDVYVYMSGTSMACPLVAGICALLFSSDSTLTNERCVDVLTSYVDDVYETNPDYDGQLGSGSANPYLALEGVAHSRPGDVDDGDSDGSVSDHGLILGPETQ